MKKILSISLALVMLVCLCLSMVSCEQDTAFSKYYSYLEGLEDQKQTVKADGITTAVAQPAVMGEDQTKYIVLQSAIQASDAMVSVSLFITDNTSTYRFTYRAVSTTTGQSLLYAEGDINALSYTGNELVEFDTYIDATYDSNYYENSHRGTATNMLKTLVLTMKPMMAKAGVNAEDFHFISVDFPEIDDAEADADTDLGGAFSAARWTYVGQMLVLGIGMVFLVLALLWVILLIFEKAMGTKEKPAKKQEPAIPATPAPVSKPTPAVAPVADDGATVAAITAAIAAMIASDEGLSREFAGGFRVVSFRKKSGRGAWND